MYTDFRKPTMNSKHPQATGGKYGFIHKVIDGLTLRVNALIITFKSPAFQASLQVCSIFISSGNYPPMIKFLVFSFIQLSRILLESCTPNWQPADSRFSRLKDPELGFILVFKVSSTLSFTLMWKLIVTQTGAAMADNAPGSSLNK